MIIDFLKQEKRTITLFLLVMIIGYVSSLILIGGPLTYSAPIGSLIGFLLFELWNYSRFKKEWQSNKYSNTFRGN